VFPSIKQCVFFCFHALQEHVLRWIKPLTTSPVVGALADLTRGKAELLAENALLRHQLPDAGRHCFCDGNGGSESLCPVLISSTSFYSRTSMLSIACPHVAVYRYGNADLALSQQDCECIPAWFGTWWHV